MFLDPTVTPAQATTIRSSGGPVHRGPDGSLRASAGWLLERAGFCPGRRIDTGVYCSSGRTLTLAAREAATAASFTAALCTLADAVFATDGIWLRPEPIRPDAMATTSSRHLRAPECS